MAICSWAGAGAVAAWLANAVGDKAEDQSSSGLIVADGAPVPFAKAP